jgi:predicted dehydrogenase
MQSISRRSFLKSTALTAAGAAALPGLRALGATVRQGSLIKGRKINVACVGCGGKGRSDIDGVASENIVALCDVDLSNARGAFQAFPDAKRYKDYRKMLLEMDEQIDAVTVSTPDHMHFPIAMMAVTMGKHVFVQKPLTHTIWEARTLRAAAQAHNVVTQMGIQGHCGEGIRLLKEWLDDGAIGAVHEVQYWTNRAIWPQGIDRPEEIQTPPTSLDWNLWQGVAPERPYNSAYAPFRWRGWWDYGCGALGDIGCHAMDAAFYALDLGSPSTVEAECSDHHDETAPKSSTVTYQFPARDGKPPVKVVWRDGDLKPPRPKDLEDGRELPGDIGGQLIIGDKGTILASDVYCGSLRLIPETAMRAYKRPAKSLPRSPGLTREWLDAIKGDGPAPGANFDYAGPLTEMVLLGNLAVRTGQKIEWDSASLTCTNVPEANRYVRKPYRVF